ncbi:MAG: DUF454 family protein [Victivallaceae bacterium]|nr:DUF454 family protein [Victivallaceae bacterium]
MKRLWFCLGWLCVTLGVIGIFLPVMPTTPFMLAAAFCFGRSSPRFYRWLRSNRYLDSYIENYRSGSGVPCSIIRNSLLFLWAALMASALIWDNPWYRGGLVLVGICVTVHLLCLKRSPREPLRFTLVELLVSMGVIAVLASMLLPALSRARSMALRASCAANLRQIGLAIDLYAGDNRDFIPDTWNRYWGSSLPIVRMRGGITFGLGKLIEKYGIAPEMFGCPAGISRSPEYVRSAWLSGGVAQTAYLYRETDAGFMAKKNHIDNSGKALVMDFCCISGTGDPITAHNYESVNVLFNDGHVAAKRNTPAPNEFYTVETSAASTGVPPCAVQWFHADGTLPEGETVIPSDNE